MTEQITNNFKLSEFAASDVAKRKGYNNTIPPEAAARIGILAKNLLQPMIDALSVAAGPEYTVHDDISSGYRSKELNEDPEVGGVESSQHRIGEAADNKFYKKNKKRGVRVYFTPVEVLRVLLSAGFAFDQVVLYDTFVHLSLKANGTNRRQVCYAKTYKGKKL